MQDQIHRLVSIPIGAHAIQMPLINETSGLSDIGPVLDRIDLLCRSTGFFAQRVQYDEDTPLASNTALAYICRGRRATPVYMGDFVVRSDVFSGTELGGVTVMSPDRFLRTFGFRDITRCGTALPDYPNDVEDSGKSEDHSVRMAHGLV